MYTYCKDFKDNLALKEFTINNHENYILRSIFKEQADVVCFSCYIWNIEIVKRLIRNIKKVMPNTKIVFGGPEVSYNPESENFFGADAIVLGEGEKSFYNLVLDILNGKELNKIYKSEKISLDDISFCYTDCIEDYENKIIYYESSRGCPFNCQYCLSSIDGEVRFLSEKRVKSDLDFFIKNKVTQVKFIDRTFNCNEQHALFIWNHIIENDNGVTNFHFEISADLLTDKMLETLKKARTGLIQFEIGVQSTNINTLLEIQRKTNLNKLFEKVKLIKQLGNIHIHLDLIAGLPLEGFASFRNSFNDVFSLHPDMLQLGFLKLLRGSGLRQNAEKFGIVYNDYAPYEILYTGDLSFADILTLKSIENMVDIYYNSNNFVNTLEYGLKNFETPFDFFHALSEFWEDNNYDSVSHRKIKLYEILFNFLEKIDENVDFLKDLIKFDMFLGENIKNLPAFVTKTDYSKIKCELGDSIYKDIIKTKKLLHIEKFNYAVPDCIKKDTYILFDYGEKPNTYTYLYPLW
ncbi:MAG: B12-binding domain-containing radical SAM protein [Defluviitaleaceae bacterium]|nr:B12-binding domain-containing radical SAM protein [Defluviitaleaceae bacterium]